MTEKTKVDWRLDQDDVILTIEVRMSSPWFFGRAHQIFQALSPKRRPADRLLETVERLDPNSIDQL